MPHTRYAPDRGLTTRMVTTMFFIGLLYVVFIGVLLAVFKGAWPLIVIIAGGLFVAQFWFSDRIAAFSMGAREVTPQQAPELHGAVDRLCALADMPKPRVAIADTDVPNAFATGRNQRNALVCATTGLLRRLEPEELEGVLAHELSHVAHRDVAVMTIASFLGVLAGIMTRAALWGGLSRGSRNNNVGIAVLLIPLISAVVYAISFLLTRLLSRYRELSADRAGALLTGRPSALAAALTKVTGQMARIPTRDLRKVEPYNAFFFAPALSGESVSRLFSSHPTLERRLDQLARISTQLGQAGRG
ncbi:MULTISPECIES: zinc metalloprotease HtpX [Streptomyces]|uniref:Protease HtpX homolog n=2 Tax=Streptomyces rapamycinicus TaxID=1226757 RepID=A0A0A0NKE3_STRRN|nr:MULTISPECIES: zinc metalloprotease HtpX [Streptomyces]AGP56583.1 heat shock protein HtpX [Streptomyces rapamycinicus NRRL 5491]MBB4784192.1 heat shock protein HtpX [Streptomyces rapamycinicus]MBP8534010.1 zinc metalloprotease HtpX [Streptomyces sp. MK37H]RLV80325.1 heat shock protein HtpX [Streptomyces rapamycinicus NRRL 5491]UTO64524.1 zinc metalloprotease HtpX [Streptomyces rapamycinicus]